MFELNNRFNWTSKWCQISILSFELASVDLRWFVCYEININWPFDLNWVISIPQRLKNRNFAISTLSGIEYSLHELHSLPGHIIQYSFINFPNRIFNTHLNMSQQSIAIQLSIDKVEIVIGSWNLVIVSRQNHLKDLTHYKITLYYLAVIVFSWILNRLQSDNAKRPTADRTIYSMPVYWYNCLNSLSIIAYWKLVRSRSSFNLLFNYVHVPSAKAHSNNSNKIKMVKKQKE